MGGSLLETTVDECRALRLAHEEFDLQARRRGAALAIEFEEERISYAELNRAANHLAGRLRELGLTPGGRVAILAQANPLLGAAVLGVLKAGGVYVPISPGYPAARISYILRDADAGILLTQPGIRLGDRGPHDASVQELDISDLFDGAENGALELPVVDAEQPAYVLYTSGSSGAPKGVVVSHGSLAYYLNWHRQHLRPEMGGIDLPLTSSMCFAAAVTQFYTPLLLGRTLHIVREDTIRDPAQMLAWYAQHPAFGIYCAPTLWNELVTFAEKTRSPEQPIIGPKRALLSGEAIHESLLRRSFGVWPETRIWNLYGPTETTANCTAGELSPGRAVSLGAPLAGTRIDLLDETLQPVARGEIGEICASGPGVAEGYLNLPGLTRERFLRDPIGVHGHERRFRTGDLARYNEDGELILIGRRDFQVKVRGYRIECGEIEATLSAHPAVRQAVVACRQNGTHEQHLVAYVTFYLVRNATIAELRDFLLSRLPEYMVPERIVILGSMPLLPNGKIDRVRLPAPGRSRPDPGYPAVPPESVSQKALVRIWEDTLELEGLGVTDNFFEFGGNSLKVAAAIAQITEAGLERVSYRLFFEHPTPEALAAKIGELTSRSAPGVVGLIDRPTSDAVAERADRCGANQLGLWLLTRTAPDLTAYNMQFSLRLEGELDRQAVEGALRAIVQRHEILRAVIHLEGDVPRLRIREGAEPQVVWIDFSGGESELASDELENALRREREHPFSLETGPLYRFALYRQAMNLCHLVVTVHHVVFDGLSIRVFGEEFMDHYRANKLSRWRPRPELTLTYRDWLRSEGAQLRSATAADSLQFWKNQLEGHPYVLDLPMDFAQPRRQTFRGERTTWRLSRELKERIAELARNERATPFMVLLAAFGVLLHRYTGEDDILIGCPAANREVPGARALIGFLANILVLRLRLNEAQTFQEYLAAVRDTSLECFEHQSLPFASLLEAINPKRLLNRSPLFQVMFAYHEQLFEGAVTPDLHVTLTEHANRGAKYDLTLEAADHEKGIDLGLTYNTEQFEAATMERFLARYAALLETLLRNPDEGVEASSLLDRDEKHRVLCEWNDTARENARDHCLHGLFEEQAAKTPARVAIEFEGELVSYEELNARANQLARYLQQRKIERGTCIGISMESDVEMITSLLAVLKAGCTYVPLDPFYPPERLAYIVENARVKLIITHEGLPEALSGAEAIELQVEKAAIAAQPRDNPNVPREPDSPIYIMYTSGSTGQPKGVAVPHRGACNYVLWMRDSFGWDAGDKVLNKTSINFDISVWEIFLPLITGARLVLAPRATLQSPERLARLIQGTQLTTIQFVPSALKGFLDAGVLAACTSLRRIFCGGEALSRKLQDEVFATFEGELHNLYGPTEASIYVSHWQCERGDQRRTVPIGRPIHNAKLYVLDAGQKPVPVGFKGELFIGGDVVLAHGYLNKPEITAARFFPNPHCPGERLYRTGDIARFLPDGQVELFGRSDHQVKVRGYRIELGEIEHNLTKHPKVSHAIVIVREDVPDDVRLVAYLLYRDQGGPEDAELREHLRQQLPDYMIPSSFVRLDSIPLLPNSKVNLQALPKPQYRKSLDRELERNYASELERQLAGIWEELLGERRFSVEDNFFDVGGHSLLIVRMQNLIRERLHREVSNIDIFQFPTIRSLTLHMSEGESNGAAAVAEEMARRVAQGRRKPTPFHARKD
jgi:amino acid adenylation domain-containing protein